MGTSPLTAARALANREKRWVALSSLLAAVLLVSLKFAAGMATNSLGILAEAAHSALDLLAAAVTLWAVHVAALPADHDHTYGHGKFKNLSALIETILLLLTCVWVAYEGLRRLFFTGHRSAAQRVGLPGRAAFDRGRPFPLAGPAASGPET